MRRNRILRLGRFCLLIGAVGACAHKASVPESPWERVEPPVPALPAVPERTGPLALDLVYPPEDAAIAVRDSTFVFGSTGTGEARLWINGEPVVVEPNGAFLAFLPVPPDGVYRVRASAGGESAAVIREVRTPEPPPALAPGTVAIVEGSVFPRGDWSALPGERILAGFQGSPGGTARLVLPGGHVVPLVEERAAAEEAWGRREFTADTAAAMAEPSSVTLYRGYFTARPLGSFAAQPLESVHTIAPADTVAPAGAYVELVVGIDTVREPVPLSLTILDPERLPVAVAADPSPVGVSGEPTVVGRPGPRYTYHYFWPNGTRLTLSGERDGEYRVRLTETLSAWVAADAVRLLPPGSPPATGRVGTVRLSPTPISADVRVSMAERLPFQVEVDGRTVRLTIYGGIADTGWLQYGPEDPLVERVEWSRPADEEYRLTLHLRRQPWGYLARWAENGDLVLRIRRPPEIDPDRPLRGRLIAVDAGHPPAGATGPTRLTEAEANLAIALRLRDLLEAEGARVLMTRTDAAAVPLVDRPYMSTMADAELLVSVHNNAFPDGVNPFLNNGTSVYYFQPFSVDLARAFQRRLLAEFRLRDLGIGRANLALARPTWMPSALTETMYMMIPQQEAALRAPSVQERIARAHLRAIEDFLRARAAER